MLYHVKFSWNYSRWNYWNVLGVLVGVRVGWIEGIIVGKLVGERVEVGTGFGFGFGFGSGFGFGFGLPLSAETIWIMISKDKKEEDDWMDSHCVWNFRNLKSFLNCEIAILGDIYDDEILNLPIWRSTTTSTLEWLKLRWIQWIHSVESSWIFNASFSIKWI